MKYEIKGGVPDYSEDKGIKIEHFTKPGAFVPELYKAQLRHFVGIGVVLENLICKFTHLPVVKAEKFLE